MADERRLVALATLRRGATFLTGRAELAWVDAPWPSGAEGVVKGRLLANWLRELDGFLHVVLDEVEGRTAPFDEERHSVARRLAERTGAPGTVFGEERVRLRALQRSQSALWHHAGFVRRPDERGGSWLTCGWREAGSSRLRRVRLGERLALGGTDLADVCRFYDELATRLCAATA